MSDTFAKLFECNTTQFPKPIKNYIKLDIARKKIVCERHANRILQFTTHFALNMGRLTFPGTLSQVFFSCTRTP